MAKRSEIVNLGGLWLEGHGLLEGSETLGLSSRVRRAAPSLQMQTEKPVEASCGLAKTATLTMLAHGRRREGQVGARLAQVRRLEGGVRAAKGEREARRRARAMPARAPVHRAVREDQRAARRQRARADGLHGGVGAQQADERVLGVGRVVVAVVVRRVGAARDQVPATNTAAHARVEEEAA